MERFLFRYPKDRVRKTAVLVFPNSYFIGMSNLGFHAVYHLLQSHPEIHCERAFAETGQKRVRTVESGRELTDFDVVFFSIAFEGDLPHLVRVLAASGIPLRRSDRPAGKYPLVVAGGIATAVLPRYLSEIADLTVCGDASTAIPEILKGLLGTPDRGQMLSDLDGKSGIHAGGSVRTGTLVYQRDPSRTDPFASVIVTDQTEFSDRGLIEVSSSCLFECAFCLVTKVYGDYHPFPADRIIAAAENFRGVTDKLGLVAATLSNHPDFKQIIRELNRRKFRLSFSAFRIEGLDDELLEMIVENESKTLVIAPETASAGLKKTVGKVIPNERILETVRRACGFGIRRLKLYFLIGLPGETSSDLDDLYALVAEIRDITKLTAKRFGYIPEIIVDINPLVPKPLTRFQGLAMEDVGNLKKKIIGLKNRLRRLGRTFVYGESPKTARRQYEIANGLVSLEDIEAESLRIPDRG